MLSTAFSESSVRWPDSRLLGAAWDHRGMPTIRSREPDRAREIAERGTIIRAPVGSTVHGLHNPGTDDRDEMAVCVEPPEYLLGLREFEHYVFRTQPDGVQSGPGDLDLTYTGCASTAAWP